MKNSRPSGQVVVEMLLILPVFLTIVFTIMEMGNIAFQMIMLNHATYEVARVAGMTWVSQNGGVNGCTGMDALMKRIITTASAECRAEPHSFSDLQAGVTNEDVVITGSYPVPLVFPISSIFLSSPMWCPQGPNGGRCTYKAVVRMPIERPLKR